MASNANPLFGDRVPPGSGLPPELEGKSPLEIAQYYQNREANLLRQQANPNNPPQNTPPPQPPSAEDWANDPAEAARRMQQNMVTQDQFNRTLNAAQVSLMAAAKLSASQGKKYWNRFLQEMEGIASRDPQNALDPNWWNTTYNYLLGRDMDKILTEERQAAEAAARQSSEPPGGPSTPPPTPRELAPKEFQIMGGLGLNEEAYRKGEKNLQDGRFPVTLDNRSWR